MVTKNGKINFYEKLANLEKKLSEKFFIRCHRGFLINPEHIIEIKKNTYI
ncbi:LytTR family transcriptional regulator DNA-binding domain-containing protein [Clostridium sp.]